MESYLNDLKKFADFLQERIDEYNNDEMFSIIFPVICVRLNKTDELEEIFDIFLEWWNENYDFRIINNDINIALKFEEYYKNNKYI